jgi:hypothetical protein
MTRKSISLMILFSCLSAWMGCSTSTSPKETKGSIQGMVKNASMAPLYPAFLVSGDSVLATTDEQGKYAIASLQEGTVDLVCFALNYKDTTVQVQVTGGKTTTLDFILNPGVILGRVFGEFQDDYLFNQVLKTDSTLKNWDKEHICDGFTQATLCYKMVGLDIGDLNVFLGDSLVTVADNWGQFYFTIPCGKYTFRASSQGYGDDTSELVVLPEVKNFMNFFLPRTTIGQ